MIGLIYILLSYSVGWVICTYAFPLLNNITQTDYEMRRIHLSPYLILVPAWYLTGTLAMTWPVYIIAYLFGDRQEPLFYSNMIVLPLALIVSVLGIYRHFIIKKKSGQALLCKEATVRRAELILLFLILVLACVLMWTTFYVYGDKLYVGETVFSDFSPHIGMIRSFSYGNNYPTAYSHYAGEDIKYHFMFQFLVGNLEYLGLRIDYAFNLPSIISFVNAFLLLYVMAVKISGKIKVGILACLFFAFRSSKTLFTFLSKVPEGESILDALLENRSFISDTPNEDWGLWNLNVYCNQRHLAFGISVILLVIILFLPGLFEMFEELKIYKLNKLQQEKGNHRNAFLHRSINRIKVIFLTKDGWCFKDIKNPIAIGILLGSLSFFHGAAVIACLTVLFMMAIISKRRLEFLITALITMALSFLQTGLFIQGSAVTTEFLFGFIAENKTLFGAASYLERLLGLLPFVLLAAFCIENSVRRYLIVIFTAPMVFAFTISLTVDVTVNHKYIMIACILLGIMAASLISRMLERKDFFVRLTAVFLIIGLTATGVYDFITLLRKNTEDTAIILDLRDPLTEWIDEHTDSKDIFLTSNYAINQVVLGGAMLYKGWDYFPWSAGYDTDARSEQVKNMYEAATPEELDSLVKANNIRYIIVDGDNRVSEEYILNEDNINRTYEIAYRKGQGEWMLTIYDTEKRIN